LLKPELNKEIKFPTQKEINLTPVLEAIEKKDFVFPDIPEQQKIDLKPFMRQFASLKKEIAEVVKKMTLAIKGIKFPKQERLILIYTMNLIMK